MNTGKKFQHIHLWRKQLHLQEMESQGWYFPLALGGGRKSFKILSYFELEIHSSFCVQVAQHGKKAHQLLLPSIALARQVSAWHIHISPCGFICKYTNIFSEVSYFLNPFGNLLLKLYPYI